MEIELPDDDFSESKHTIEDFHEGLAYVCKGDRIGFVDKKGKSTFDY